MEGDGVMRVTNTGSDALRSLRLSWDGKSTDELSVMIDGAPVDLVGEAASLRTFRLPAPLGAGESKEISLRFSRSTKPLKAGESLRLANWHPRLSSGYETQASFNVGVEAPPGVVVAASARRDLTTGRYVAAGIRSFGLWFGRGYEVKEAVAGETLVRVIFLPAMRECAHTVIANAVDAIQFYRQRFGLYPQPSLTIVPGEPSPVVGGYPFATSLVMLHSMEAFATLPATHWRWIVAHEIGHQYWLEHVMAKESEHSWGWLMIGLGIWVDREYSRERGMKELHPGRLASYATTVRNGMDTTVEMPAEKIRRLGYDYNSQVTHNKAYGIVSALAALLGRDTFDRVHARCLRAYGGARMGTAEFRGVAERESGQDLGWFFTPWLKTSGYASYELVRVNKTEQAGTQVVKAVVRQAGPIAMPVPVEARFEDGSRQRLWTDRFLREQTLEWHAGVALKEITIDPDREFPLVVPPPVPERQELVSKILGLPWTGVGHQAAELYEQTMKLKLDDSNILTKLWLLLYDSRFYENALDICGRVERASRGSDQVRTFMAAAWQGILLDLLGRREQALERYRAALPLAGTAKMQHGQYNLVIDRSFVEQRLKEPFVRK
jgi:hypothetical protein